MKSDNKYSPNQVLTNKQIDILTAPNTTWKGGVIAESIDFEGAQMVLSQYEMEYLQALDCVVDIGKAIVADLESPVNNLESECEFTNQVFSAELINKVNEERAWAGGVVVAETDFTDNELELKTSGKVEADTVHLESGVMRNLEVITKEGLEVAQSKRYDVKLGKDELDDFHL